MDVIRSRHWNSLVSYIYCGYRTHEVLSLLYKANSSRDTDRICNSTMHCKYPENHFILTYSQRFNVCI